MYRTLRKQIFCLAMLLVLFYATGRPGLGQTHESIVINTDDVHQTVTGWGASLAYYEGWLNAHPNRSEIYEAIFGELSLDILRVRNAHEYDSGMIDRVKEYVVAAQNSLGYPIDIMVTSWGPPGRLKNTGDRKNGGTLRYTTGPGGVQFDYEGFAGWWNSSLDEYNQNGIYPTYISIQNEPGWTASWETCILAPTETVNATDTIAGYNKALDAVYDSIQTRERKPLILGPEVLGIGYNLLENYTNALDLSKLDGLAHHLYHGVDENDPYASTDITKAGNFHPEIPHFQTEYSRGDWFALGGLIYRSLVDEEVVAYLYWDLIWNEGGLVTLEFPWDQDRWTDPLKGYIKTRDFYAFKQFSAFIQPGWQRLGLTGTPDSIVAMAFVSPGMDSATCVVINRSDSEDCSLDIRIPGYVLDTSSIYVTSDSLECEYSGALAGCGLRLLSRSITTIQMLLSPEGPDPDTVAPSAPGNLMISDLSYTSLTVKWDPSTDNVGVDGYRLYLDNLLEGATDGLEYTFPNLQPNTSYQVAVSAYDSTGNNSQHSSIQVVTLAYDTIPPTLQVPDTVQAGSEIEVLSSEEGVVYLVPDGTGNGPSEILGSALDSSVVEAGASAWLSTEALSNGVYRIYGRDTVWNVSEPADVLVLNVGIGIHTKTSFHIYPVPAVDRVNLRFSLEESQAIRAKFINSKGVIVYNKSLGEYSAGIHETLLQISGIPPGFYMLQVDGKEGQIGTLRVLLLD